MTIRRAIIQLAIGQTIFWAGLYYIFAALLIRWEMAEGWSKTTLTGAFTGAILMAALFSPIAGRLVDCGHGPKTLTGAALIGAGLVALLPTATNEWMFVAIYLGLGACLGCCLYETCFAFVTRTRGKESKRAITLITLFAGFASTLSFPLCHAISEAFGWHYAAFTLSGMVILIGVPLISTAANFLESRHQQSEADIAAAAAASPEPPEPQPAPVSLFKNPVFWLIAGGFALLAGNHGIIINHMLPILDDRGLSGDAAVLIASMVGPMQVAGRLAMMAVENRISSHAITTACFFAVGGATAALFYSTAISMLLVLFVILQGSGHGVTSIMRPVIVRELMGEKNFGAISGAIAVPYLMMWAAAPLLGSLLWTAGGYDLALMVIGGFAVIGLFSYRAAVMIAR
jgi:MFS family permease